MSEIDLVRGLRAGNDAAFEELVGAHGGLGGWQDRGVVLAPTELAACLPERIEGADQLHQALVRMLRERGMEPVRLDALLGLDAYRDAPGPAAAPAFLGTPAPSRWA